LPSKSPHEHRQGSRISYPTGVVERTVSFGQEPKSLVWLSSSAPMPWSREAQRDAQVLEWLLRIRLREVLRDDLGGVYNVNVNAHLFRGPDARQRLDVSFACAPANADKLKQALFDELATLASNGIAEDYLTKVREQLRRRHELDLHDNAWWAASLRDAYYYGDGFAEIADLDALLARVTGSNIRETTKRMFDPKGYVLVVLRPSTPN
jgi:zinc protease